MRLFKSKEERELERRIKIQENKRRIERYILKQRKKVDKYWSAAKKAVRLSDEKMFEQIATLILATQRDINNWERSMLSFEVMEARTEQIAASADFARAYEAMSKSMLANSNPANLAKIQLDVERATMRAQAMGTMMENFVDISANLLDEGAGLEQDAELRQIMETLKAEADQESNGFDNAEIEASLRAIEAQLKRS